MANSCGRQRYYNDISIIQIGQYIKSDCSDITFLNTGTSNVVLNQAITILPNQSVQFNCNKDEIDVTNYNIFFSGAGANSCTIIRKLYVD
jgi:hypothetical protein